MGGRHYTAKCENPENQHWYLYNDSIVTETTARQAVSDSAYVVFYRRRGTGISSNKL